MWCFVSYLPWLLRKLFLERYLFHLTLDFILLGFSTSNIFYIRGLCVVRYKQNILFFFCILHGIKACLAKINQHILRGHISVTNNPLFCKLVNMDLNIYLWVSHSIKLSIWFELDTDQNNIFGLCLIGIKVWLIGLFARSTKTISHQSQLFGVGYMNLSLLCCSIKS